MTNNSATKIEWDLPHAFDYLGQSVRFGIVGNGAPLPI